MKLEEVISKYGEVKLTFDFYHKHTFKFDYVFKPTAS